MAQPGSAMPGKKIRLHRMFNSKEAVIKKNLEHMKESAEKKRQAQAFYYGSDVQNNVSPLKRFSSNEDGNKPPVHARLGKKLRLRHVNLAGTNTSAIPPKQNKFFNRNRQQTPFMKLSNPQNFRQGKFIRLYNAQSRILKIRQNQNNIQMGNQKIRLHRPQPQNFMVKVHNNPNMTYVRHSIKRDLNPVLQEEIKLIQAQTSIHQHVGDVPVLVVTTSLCLNDRFSQIN